MAVCNLASINLSRHVTGRRQQARVDWERLAESTRLAVRQLDNLIDITVSSVPESEHSNRENRALGLGVMGFTDIVERFGFSYESEEAYELIDQVMEFVSWHAIDASAPTWPASAAPTPTSRARAGARAWCRSTRSTCSRPTAACRSRSTARPGSTGTRCAPRSPAGIRNSTLMAIAPTASIGLVAGTTPGLDPQFSQIFSRATSSGKFLEVNRNLVEDLRALGLWEQVREDLLRHQGDLSQGRRASRPELQAIYRTSFQLSPYAFLNVAARAQKWIDQAISRNIYLASRDVGEMVDLYSAAWRMGVKTTYYLHMMPRHTAEQSTVKVNKADDLRHRSAATPRRGFGAAAPASGVDGRRRRARRVGGAECRRPQERRSAIVPELDRSPRRSIACVPSAPDRSAGRVRSTRASPCRHDETARHPRHRHRARPAAQARDLPVGHGPLRPGRRQHLVPQRDPARRGPRRLRADDRRGTTRTDVPDELLQPQRAARQQGAGVRRLPVRQRRGVPPLPRQADVGGGQPLHELRVRPRDVPDRPGGGVRLARHGARRWRPRRSSRSASSSG